jgi:hypothetical protein
LSWIDKSKAVAKNKNQSENFSHVHHGSHHLLHHLDSTLSIGLALVVVVVHRVSGGNGVLHVRHGRLVGMRHLMRSVRRSGGAHVHHLVEVRLGLRLGGASANDNKRQVSTVMWLTSY